MTWSIMLDKKNGTRLKNTDRVCHYMKYRGTLEERSSPNRSTWYTSRNRNIVLCRAAGNLQPFELENWM